MLYYFPFLLFYIDLFILLFFQKGIISFLFLFFILANFVDIYNNILINSILIFLLLLQDYFFYGTVGTCLFYILPVLVFAHYLKKTIESRFLWVIGLFFFILIQFHCFFS